MHVFLDERVFSFFSFIKNIFYSKNLEFAISPFKMRKPGRLSLAYPGSLYKVNRVGISGNRVDIQGTR